MRQQCDLRDASAVDLLETLLRDASEDAARRLQSALHESGPTRIEVTFNTIDVILDYDLREVHVLDVLDGRAQPEVIPLDEFRRRLG
jgi:hypothetical protein